jgi:hypothetical protein
MNNELCLHMGVVVGMESLVNQLHPRWKCPLILKRLSEESFLLRQALFVIQATGMSSGLICMFQAPAPPPEGDAGLTPEPHPARQRSVSVDKILSRLDNAPFKVHPLSEVSRVESIRICACLL